MHLEPAEDVTICDYCGAPAAWCDLDAPYDNDGDIAFYCADHSALGYDGRPIVPGSRIELHPGCDLWMRGARFGDVVGVGLTLKDKVRFKLDKTGERLWSAPADLVRAI